MGNLPYYFVAFVALGLALALITVWARRGLWLRTIAALVFASLLGLQYFALSDLLSRPKPTVIEFQSKAVEEATVLAATFDEGTAIYLWLRLPDVRQPRYYALPWHRKTAIELQKAIREADRHGTRVIMRRPFNDATVEQPQPRFYDVPSNELPTKPVPEVMEYRHPSLSV